MLPCRSLFLFGVLISSSKELHNRMLSALVRAPIRCAVFASPRCILMFAPPCSFFDATPVGRVLNRFSNDIGIMDDLLPNLVVDFLQTFFVVRSKLVQVASLPDLRFDRVALVLRR